VRGSVTDVTGEMTVFEMNGETDADGVYRYTVPVPDFFVGRLDNHSAQIDLEIDRRGHSQSQLESIDDSDHRRRKAAADRRRARIRLAAAGLANRVYLDVSTPTAPPRPPR
jgi:CD109 antigen